MDRFLAWILLDQQIYCWLCVGHKCSLVPRVAVNFCCWEGLGSFTSFLCRYRVSQPFISEELGHCYCLLLERFQCHKEWLITLMAVFYESNIKVIMVSGITVSFLLEVMPQVRSHHQWGFIIRVQSHFRTSNSNGGNSSAAAERSAASSWRSPRKRCLVVI